MVVSVVSLSSPGVFVADVCCRSVDMARRVKNFGSGGAGGGIEKPGDLVEKLFGEFCDCD